MCSLRNAPGFGLPFRWRYKWSSSFLNFRWKLCGILCALLSNSSTFSGVLFAVKWLVGGA